MWDHSTFSKNRNRLLDADVAAKFLEVVLRHPPRSSASCHHVEAALVELDLSALKRVCIDETAAKRGHSYMTLFIDIDARKVVHVAKGRGDDRVAEFADWATPTTPTPAVSRTSAST